MGERRWMYSARIALGVLAVGLGMIPALSQPDQSEGLTAGANTQNHYVPIWEPAGRDRWSQLRQLHARREATACDYVKLARIERLFHHPELDATYTQESAKLGGCPKFFQRF